MLVSDGATNAATEENVRTGPQQKYVDKLRNIVKRETWWLDIGCGRKIAPDWALSQPQQTAAFGGSTLIGIDVDMAIREHPLLKARAFALADDLPFRNESFDLVSANMVMEHVRNPARVLSEVHRVLKPGGMFVFHTPNYMYYPVMASSVVPQKVKERLIWLIERRHESDVFPTAYRINTGSTIRKLALQTGFTVSELQYNAPGRVFLYWLPIARTIEAGVNKLLTRRWAERFRSNLLVVLTKPGRP
jgi:SAM-dependent methyltransferase